MRLKMTVSAVLVEYLAGMIEVREFIGVAISQDDVNRLVAQYDGVNKSRAQVVTEIREIEFDVTKEMIVESDRLKRIVVATEWDDKTEALYVDGSLITCEQTIYASEISAAADGQPVLIINRQVNLGDGGSFPKDEAELVDVES